MPLASLYAASQVIDMNDFVEEEMTRRFTPPLTISPLRRARRARLRSRLAEVDSLFI